MHYLVFYVVHRGYFCRILHADSQIGVCPILWILGWWADPRPHEGLSNLVNLVCQIWCSLWWHRMAFLPCLSDCSQLCGSYLWCLCLGQGMYRFFVCSRATVSRWNLYSCSWQLDLLWNTIILVLLRFTVRAQVWQNLCRRSRCCWRPSLVGDRGTRSSTNNRHLTSDSSRVRPGAADCSSALANFFICWREWGFSCIPVSTHGPVERGIFVCQF